MKAFFALMILTIGLVFAMPAWSAVDPPDQNQTFVIDQQHVAPAVMAQEEGGVVLEQAEPGEVVVDANGVKDFLLKYWFELLSGLIVFLHIIVKLTPTEKDNDVLKWIVNLLNAFIPNYKKGGGTFEVSSK